MGEISVVLNVYNRHYALEKQIECIKNQSIPIKSENIHIWYNKSDDGEPQALPQDPNIRTYQCNWNTKFFGRFTLPLLVKTPYIALFDDDTMPGKDWLKSCMETINKPETNGILGTTGVILHRKAYVPCNKIGWNSENNINTGRVDLVGHAWFFRQEWTKYLWMEKPASWDNGEDIMFSYLAQKYGGVNTFVPPHPKTNMDIWGNDLRIYKGEGSDKHSTYRKGGHTQIRNQVCLQCINNGWDTVKKIK